MNDYYQKNKERIKKNTLLWQKKNAKLRNEYMRNYRLTHHEFNERAKKRSLDYYYKHQEEIAIKIREIKKTVFKHYTKDEIKCLCCNEKNISFLSLDHINNDGIKHRSEKKCGKGPYFYKWLMENNYPEGLQIMCMNCNWARSRYGVCPHQNPMK